MLVHYPRGSLSYLVAPPVDPVDHVVPALPRVERHSPYTPHKKSPEESDTDEEKSGGEQPGKPASDHIVDDYA
ncbi:MAG: hypothetical protein D4R48_04000 [Nitrosomonadales bacterium]|nr:MAG: hypothetical protein D4R48_04000 [Nitrosomonadales bacterium]